MGQNKPLSIKLLLLGNLPQRQDRVTNGRLCKPRLPCTKLFITEGQAPREVEMEVVWVAEKKEVREDLR